MKKKIIILIISLFILNYIRYALPFYKTGDINELKEKYGINTDLGFQYAIHASIVPFMSYYSMNIGLTINDEYRHYYVDMADYAFLLKDIPSFTRISKDYNSTVIDEYCWGEENRNHSIIYTNNLNIYSLSEVSLKKGVAIIRFWLLDSEDQSISNKDLQRIKDITEVFMSMLFVDNN